ncbi:diaminopimelate epimerase [Lutibacter sp.]|uniref:diaminopimelate epimerase n=1 Tax=Lutibacter sp. TaxID=1925666 RepID=UPI0025BBACC9|nr:diaminopimelate epimerase [Lutibacter sp.]MCF6180982.1 diaminopimelate epimerase [Lutibacter sp.]
MNLHFYKYQGAGNDFIMMDNRALLFPKNNQSLINKLCDRRFGIGADGLILLENSINYDFKMTYFNANGKEGTMCGNGGRCIVAFAKELNIIEISTTFEAIDGEHTATLKKGLISLKMMDIDTIEEFDNHTFLNTGSPHHIIFQSDIDTINIKDKGAKIRYGKPYFEEGANVNFVEQISDDAFKMRTYERGVEDETLACGTGATAVAIAANKTNKTTANSIKLKVLGGKLEVSFNVKNKIYTDVFLTGPAVKVFEGNITI